MKEKTSWIRRTKHDKAVWNVARKSAYGHREECATLHNINPGFVAEPGSLKSPNEKFKQGENWLVEALLFGGTQFQACVTSWSSDSWMMLLLVPGLDHEGNQEGSLAAGGAQVNDGLLGLMEQLTVWDWTWAPSVAPALQASLQPLHTP